MTEPSPQRGHCAFRGKSLRFSTACGFQRSHCGRAGWGHKLAGCSETGVFSNFCSVGRCSKKGTVALVPWKLEIQLPLRVNRNCGSHRNHATALGEYKLNVV